MKIVQIISEHKKKATKGMVEAIVRLKDGTLATQHVYRDKVETETSTTPAPESN
jgi:hypothetical protein